MKYILPIKSLQLSTKMGHMILSHMISSRQPAVNSRKVAHKIIYFIVSELLFIAEIFVFLI